MADEGQPEPSSEPAVDGNLHAEDLHVAGGGCHVRPLDLERPHGDHVEETRQAAAPEAQKRATAGHVHPPASTSEKATPAPPRPQAEVQQ